MQVIIEELARGLACAEGNQIAFDTCKNDALAEDHLGRYEGYMSEAHALLTRCPKLQKAISVYLSGVTI